MPDPGPGAQADSPNGRYIQLTSNNDRSQGEGGINAIEPGAIEYLGDGDEGDVTSGVTGS